MPRNVRTYDHFCVLARALERIGERWTLLVVRDLLSGPKRFTDLMDRLSGITPKTLTQRLGELEAGGLIEAERTPGRRQVWYRLTPAGRDLTPTIETLSWWGLRYAWRPPHPDEALHVEHLLQAMTRVLDRTSQEREPARWHIHFRDVGDYLVESDGHRWSLTMAEPHETPDVSVTATTATWKRFILDPTSSRARALGVELSGPPSAIARFERLIRSWRDAVEL